MLSPIRDGKKLLHEMTKEPVIESASPYRMKMGGITYVSAMSKSTNSLKPRKTNNLLNKMADRKSSLNPLTNEV